MKKINKGTYRYRREEATRPKSEETKRRMSEAGKLAWATKRGKAIIGEERVIDGRIMVRMRSAKGWLYWKLKDGQPHLPTGRSGHQNPFYAKRHSLKTREGLRRYALGRKPSKKTRQKMSLSHKGHKKSLEWRRKIAESHRKYPYNKTARDKAEKDRIRRGIDYKEWRTGVFKRDNYTCRSCGARSGRGKSVYIEAHHIKSFTHYPESRFDINNGITLCRSCHKKENSKQMAGNKNGLKRNKATS